MKRIEISGSFLLILCLFALLPINAYAQEVEPAAETIILGACPFDEDPAALPWSARGVSSSSDDFTLTLKDVHFTDGLMSFTIETRTSVSSGNASASSALYLNGETRTAGGGVGIEPGPDVRTETYAWYNAPSAYGMDWESFRITFENIFFTFHDGGQTVYLAPAESYDWSFVFHNPENSDYNADGFAPTVDEKGIHTFGNSFDIFFGGGVVSKGLTGEYDTYSFNLVTKSDLLNNYGSQESMWYNGIHRAGGGGSIEFDDSGDPVLPADGKFKQSDHFVYQVPPDFSASEQGVTIWAEKVNFEISCTGESVDPEMGYTWSWSDDLTDREGKSVFPVKLVQFHHANDRLPQPDDPVLFSQTVNGVTIDLVGLDYVTVPLARLYLNPDLEGESSFVQLGLCYPLPDDGEWNIVPGEFMIGDAGVWGASGGFGGKVPATAEAPGRQCSFMRFPVDGLSIDPEDTLSFVVREMRAAPREGSPCKDILHRFETNAAAQALGITLQCEDNVTDEWIRGPKDYILTVDTFDSTRWTREEIQSEIERILEPNIPGPWQFEIENIGSYL
ncbi:MAG: hypothetical protein IJI14_04170 [Anaerolineaceae bacterium]|nr:hypothetical protein [Anaerolineaceae bacterium]